MMKLITDPNPRGIFFILTFFFIISFAAVVFASEPGVENIQKSIQWLLRKNPNHQLNKNPEERNSFSQEILDQSQKYDIDPYLLTAMIYLESTFRTNATGGIGEQGLSQVHGIAARGCDLKTPRGQIECGARYLRSRIDHCGSIRGGLAAYAAGRCKVKPGEKLFRVVERRLRLAYYLSRLD